MTRAAILAFVFCALAACGGDVYYVDVRPADNLGCAHTVERLTSVEVDVIRETNDGLEEVPNLGSCETVGPTNDVVDLLTPFEEAGQYVSGAPAGSRTLLRFFGYRGEQRCFRGSEIVCGITCPFVRQGEIPEEGVEAAFVCRSLVERVQRIFSGCQNLEQLNEESRALICNAEGTGG